MLLGVSHTLLAAAISKAAQYFLGTREGREGRRITAYGRRHVVEASGEVNKPWPVVLYKYFMGD